MVLYFKLLVCLYVCTLWICIWMYGLPHSLSPCAAIVESLKQSAVRGVGVRGAGGGDVFILLHNPAEVWALMFLSLM